MHSQPHTMPPFHMPTPGAREPGVSPSTRQVDEREERRPQSPSGLGEGTHKLQVSFEVKSECAVRNAGENTAVVRGGCGPKGSRKLKFQLRAYQDLGPVG